MILLGPASRSLLSAALASACLLSASSLRAEEPPLRDVSAARRLFADAEKDEAAGRWLDVIQKLRRIVAFKETAGVRFHLALAEEHSGQLVAAQADYQRAFDLSRTMRDADGRDVNERSGKSLVELLARTPMVTIVPDPEVPEARVTVDGLSARGATERPFSHDPGEIVIEATAAGRSPFRAVRKLAEGAKVVVTLALPAVKSEPATTNAATSSSTPAPAAPPEPSSRIPAFVLGGVAVAGLATGITYGIQYSRLDETNGEICGRPDVVCDPRRAGVAARERNIAIVGGAVGLVSAAACVYLFTRGPAKVALSPTELTYVRAF